MTSKVQEKVDKLKNEVKKADKQKDTVREINYHKYNNYVTDKGIELHQANKELKREQELAESRETAYEAATQIHNLAVGKTSFFFEGIDKLFHKD